MLIIKNKQYQDCGGSLIVSIIGGSNLYGLNTSYSDVDERGIFVATDKKYKAGFENISSIVLNDPSGNDLCYYELGRYLHLLRKSNTQSLELLFAPDEFILYSSDVFEKLRENRYSLINTEVLKSSLKGYVFSEIRLATGQRSGQLGGKRKAAVEKYGFSPKNFTQIFRLCQVGIEFFTSGKYMVNVQEFNPKYHEFLMGVKTEPEQYTCEQLEQMVNDKFSELERVIETSTIRFDFDVDLASEILLNAKYGN